jgi:hypothetical protein
MADLASLYLYFPGSRLCSHEKQYQKAVSLLEKLPVMTSDQGWTLIECALMKMYAECLQSINDVSGYINILLKLLLHRRELAPSEGEQYMSELEKELSKFKNRTSQANVNIAIDRPLHDFFTLHISARAGHRDNKDGFRIKIILTNHLPRTITATKIKVKVTSISSGEEIWFTTSTVELKPGRNEIWTTCNITAPGVYIFERAVLEWFSLFFRQDFIDAGRKQSLSLYPHGNALRVNAEMAGESIALGCIADGSLFRSAKEGSCYCAYGVE